MKSAFIVSTEPFSSRMLLRLLCVYLRQHCVFIDRLFNLSKFYLTGDWMSNKLGRPVEAVKDQEYFMEKPLFTRSDIYRNWSKWNALYFLTKKHHTHTHRNVLLTERHHKRHSFTCRRWIYSARLGSDSLPTIFFRAFHFHWDRLFVFDQLKYSRSLFDISSHRMTQLLIHSVQSEKWHRKQRCRVSSTKLFWHWKIVCCPRIDWRRRHRNKMGSINKWRLICVFWVASWFKWLAFYWNCLRWVNTQQASHLSLLYWFAMVVDESEREHQQVHWKIWCISICRWQWPRVKYFFNASTTQNHSWDTAWRRRPWVASAWHRKLKKPRVVYAMSSMYSSTSNKFAVKSKSICQMISLPNCVNQHFPFPHSQQANSVRDFRHKLQHTQNTSD